MVPQVSMKMSHVMLENPSMMVMLPLLGISSHLSQHMFSLFGVNHIDIISKSRVEQSEKLEVI